MKTRQSSVGVDGFTLIELIVVIAVMSILLAIVFAGATHVREKARSAVCYSNLRSLTMATITYAADHGGYLPWAGGVDRNLPNDWVWGGQGRSSTENTSYWDNPPDHFGHHAEAGSLFPYTVGNAPIRNGTGRNGIDETHRGIYDVYRCPSTGKLGLAQRVNYSMNNWIDSNQFDGAVSASRDGVALANLRNPADKVLLINEDPRTMHNASFHPGGSAFGGGSGSAFDGGSLHITHLGRINIGHADGHCSSRPAAEVIQMQRTDIVVQGISNRDRYFHPLR